MLDILLKQFRSNPIIKQALGRGEPPDQEALYMTLQEFLKNPTFLAFVNDCCYQKWWSGSPLPTDRRKHDDPFVDRSHIDYSGKEPKHSNSYIRLAQEISLGMSRAVRGKLSPEARRELVGWCNTNGASRPALSLLEKEGKWIGAVPENPVTVYRGIMFRKSAMGIGSSTLDDNHPRSARIFMNALLHGHTEVYLNTPKPASWTTSEDIARRFATKRAASSYHTAMINWIHNSNRFIDGDLGLILSATLYPSQIICDVNLIDIGHLLNHGGEGEIIAKAGPHMVEIEHVYTPTGEIAGNEFAAYLQSLQEPKK